MTHSITLHTAYFCFAHILLIPCAQILKEIMFQNPGNLHQRLRIDPRAGVDEIDIVAVAS